MTSYYYPGDVSEDSAYYTGPRRTACPQCKHKHVEGHYCHMFVPDPLHQIRMQKKMSRRQTTAPPTTTASSSETLQTNYEDWLDADEDIPGRVEKKNKGIFEAGMEYMMGLTKGGGKKAEGEDGHEEGDEVAALIMQTKEVEQQGAIQGNGRQDSKKGAVPFAKEESREGPKPEGKERWKDKEPQQGDDDDDDDDDDEYQKKKETTEPVVAKVAEEGDDEGEEDDDSDGGSSQEKGDDDDDDDDDDDEPYVMLVGDELNVPRWAKKGGYKRCGCREGVPKNNRYYTPIPPKRYVGEILVRAGFAEEVCPLPICEPPHDYVPYILSFLTAREVAKVAMVNNTYLQLARMDPNYYDMAAMYCEQTLAAHDGYVDAVLYRKGHLYTAGEQKCKLWNPQQGQQVSVLFRDQTDIVMLRTQEPRFLYAFLFNGQIRKWEYSFDIDKIRFATIYAEHGGCVNDAVLSAPSIGPCKRHTLFDHQCFIYTCSDDRTVKVWDTSEDRCVSTITPPIIYGSSPRSVALTPRHLFVGSSTGRIYVYSLNRLCERPDIHKCKEPRVGPQPYCLQTTLEHGDTILRCLLATGPSSTQTFLVSGAVDGTVNMWRIPPQGLDFQLYGTWDLHKGAIQSTAVTWNNLYIGSADGRFSIFNLSSNPQFIRFIQCGVPIKSLYVAEPTTEEDWSRLFVGLGNGQVQVWRLGLYG